jgi:hypothetical protein
VPVPVVLIIIVDFYHCPKGQHGCSDDEAKDEENLKNYETNAYLEEF